jgi:spore coat protein CotH
MSWRSNYDQSGNLLLTAPYGTKTGKETYFIYNYPKSDVITSEQKKYISKYVDDFEKALLSANFKDPSVGYAAYIDVPSFIDFMLLNEFSHNPDGYRLSTFLHKDRGAKLKMGPIWDFNIAFGNHDNSTLAATNNWIYDFNSYVPGDTWLIHFWWKRLLQDPAFTAQAKARWASIRADKFSNENMNAIIDKHVGYLQKYNAINKHFAKWQVLGVKMPFNGYVGQTYNDELTFFRNWINARLAWMDAQIKLL